MADPYFFTSERLGFRRWKPADLPLFIAMNKSAEVMHYFPSTLSDEETTSLFDRIETHFDTHGYGFYAVDELQTHQWIGFIGFQNVRFEAEFTPAVEIGYRLLPSAWGKGIGSEGSLASLKHASTALPFNEVVSFTAKINIPSQRVMQKIGMNYQGDFDHPMINPNDRLYRHVLYHISLKQ